MIKWLKMIAEFSFLQSFIIGLNFACGLIIIRVLPPEEYAVYALGLAGLNILNGLSDIGIIQAVTALGGKVWTDKAELGKVIFTGLKARLPIFIFVAFFILPIQIGLIYKHTSSILIAFLFFLLIIPDSYYSLTSEIFLIGARLNKATRLIQRNEMVETASRLVFTASLFFAPPIGLLVYSFRLISGALKYFLIKKDNEQFFLMNEASEPFYQNQIRNSIRSILPNSIYLSIQGQLQIWLISIFGKTTQIAQLSALGKLSAILMVFSSMMTNLILPAFSRMTDPKQLLKRFAQFFSVLTAMQLIAFLIILHFPAEVLWILGKNYSHLEEELVYAIINAFLSLTVNCIWGINFSRNWVKYSWSYIPQVIALQTILICYLHLNSVKNVFIFGLMSQLPALFTGLFIFLFHLRKFNIEKKEIETA